MIPLEVCPHLTEVPEDTIKKAAELYAPGVQNGFKELLSQGAAFRRAGLEPIYLMTMDQENFTVSSKETYAKLLH